MSEKIMKKEEKVQVVELDPTHLLEKAKKYAEALVNVVEQKKLYVEINKQKYVKCEGWTTLAAFHNVHPVPRETEWTENPKTGELIVQTRVELINKNGEVMGAGIGLCSSEEKLYKKDGSWVYRWKKEGEIIKSQMLSMAQTRATSKACRLAFSWIMTLAGYEPTPAEEMEITMPVENGETGTTETKADTSSTSVSSSPSQRTSAYSSSSTSSQSHLSHPPIMMTKAQKTLIKNLLEKAGMSEMSLTVHMGKSLPDFTAEDAVKAINFLQQKIREKGEGK